MPKPRAIVCVSAHWETKGVLITRAEHPRTIHDFYRFPPEFYELTYPAPGAPGLAYELERLLEPIGARADLDSWGLDHGAWCVLRWMYPEADVPVVQLSLDIRRSPRDHYAIGRALGVLRRNNILLMGSGNIVHNLGARDPRSTAPFDWAVRFDDLVVDRIEAGDHAALIDYRALADAGMAVPENEHYLPLLYVLGASLPGERPEVFSRTVLGSVSMTSVGFGLAA